MNAVRQLILCAAVSALAAACSAGQHPAPSSSAPSSSSAAAVQQSDSVPPSQVPGRFVIVHSQQVESDTVLLDTATGRTWRQVQITDVKGDPLVWEPEPQMNGPSDWAALVAEHGAKPRSGLAKSADEVLDASSTPAAP